MKLDIQKAYDSLDWGFIRIILEKMGFPTRFINYVMNCITSVSYSINFNGSAQGLIKSKREARQGDPLSPYIFILCAEVLSTNLGVLEKNGELKGLKIARKSPPILHLMYADDLLITCSGDMKSCATLKELLHRYSNSIGQAINQEKSSIIHHQKLAPELVQQLQQCFNIKETTIPPTYLGIQFKR